MEKSLLTVHPAALVIRTSSFFGPWDQANFVTRSLQDLRAGEVVTAANDVVVSPTYLPDLVNAALDLLIDRERGVWHLTNAGALTWYELARRAAEMMGLAPARIEGRPVAELGLAAPRPRYSALASERGWIMPRLEDALTRYGAAIQHRGDSAMAAA
jgi:dTDP-4-dehydrorhamnose reductase